jgi:hypothetical protein
MRYALRNGGTATAGRGSIEPKVAYRLDDYGRVVLA